MSLLQLKKDYEQFMFDSWHDTPIHWAGTTWDTTAQDEWVYFEYVGQTVADCGLDNTEYQHKGVLDITIVGASRFRVNEIADSIMSLYKGSKIGNTFVKGVNMLGTGILQDTSKSYMDMNLQISML